MAKSAEVVKAPDNLPELARTPAVDDIDSRDISLPRLYKGEQQSDIVQTKLAPQGSIYVAAGPDDPDPQVLVADATDDALGDAEGVLVHVLDVRRGLNYRDPVTKEFSSWRWGDPQAHPDAKKCYHYVLALPEVDEDVPVKLTLASTSRRVGDRINFHLLKNTGPRYELAFRLSLKNRSREEGGSTQRWLQWVEKLVEAKPEHVEAAARLASFVAAASDAPQASAVETTAGEGPAI